MRLAARPARPVAEHPWTELRQGFGYAFGFPPIAALICLVAAISAIGFPYTVLTPVFARDVFRGDARTLGYADVRLGHRRLERRVYLGARTTIRGLGKVIAFGGAAMGVGLIGFAASRWLPLSLACPDHDRDGRRLADGFEQHDGSDARGGRQAGAGDEHFLDGFTGTMPWATCSCGSWRADGASRRR